MVGGIGALDDFFSQAPNGFDDYLVFVVGHRIDGKHDAGNLCLNHGLHRDGDADAKVVKALLFAIEDGPGLKE